MKCINAHRESQQPRQPCTGNHRSYFSWGGSVFTTQLDLRCSAPAQHLWAGPPVVRIPVQRLHMLQGVKQSTRPETAAAPFIKADHRWSEKRHHAKTPLLSASKLEHRCTGIENDALQGRMQLQPSAVAAPGGTPAIRLLVKFAAFARLLSRKRTVRHTPAPWSLW